MIANKEGLTSKQASKAAEKLPTQSACCILSSFCPGAIVVAPRGVDGFDRGLG